jgi:hypothetical protein
MFTVQYSSSRSLVFSSIIIKKFIRVAPADAPIAMLAQMQQSITQGVLKNRKQSGIFKSNKESKKKPTDESSCVKSSKTTDSAGTGENGKDDGNQEQRVDPSVSLESNVFPPWSEYPQIEMVREVQRSYNMTLTPVVPMAAGTGFGTGSETTMTLPASAAKSKPVEKPKG